MLYPTLVDSHTQIKLDNLLDTTIFYVFGFGSRRDKDEHCSLNMKATVKNSTTTTSTATLHINPSFEQS